jgi:hypothetical protein
LLPSSKAPASCTIAPAWPEILCIQEQRTVGNDNTVKWRRLSLQLPQSRLRPHFVKAVVRVHEYPDGAIAVFLGPHRLADYDAAGKIRPATDKATRHASATAIFPRGMPRGKITTKRTDHELPKPANLTS